jgi:hypothetical protein
MRSRTVRPSRLSIVIVLSLASAAAAQQPLPTARVAFTGEPAPGTGANYALFHYASINPSGQVLFGANLNGLDVTESNDTAAFLGPARPAGPQLLAREGGPAPVGSAGATFGEITTYWSVINSEGLGLITAALRGAPQQEGTFVGTPGSLRSVSPGGGPPFFDTPLFNAGPRAVFWPQTNQGLLQWDGSALTTVPTPASVYQPTINRSGRITFGVLSSYEAAYVGTPGNFRSFATSGSRAPGTPQGHVFDMIPAVSQNDAGLVSVNAWVRPPSGDRRFGGVWAGAPDDLRLVALDGQPAPGIAGYYYDWLLYDIDTPRLVPIDGTGRVVFTGVYATELGEIGGVAAWAGRPDDVRLVAKRGDVLPLPGGSGGRVTVQNLRHDQIWLNDRGDLAMLASTTVPSGNLGGNATLLAAGAGGDLEVITRIGSAYAVEPGYYLTVSGILLPEGTGGQDGRATVLNEAGQLVYTLRFEEGFSGVFVTTIPEPGAAGGVLLVSATLLGSRRRRR